MLNKIKKLNPALIWLSTIAIFIVFIFLLSSNLIDFSNSSNPINALMLIAFLTDILVGIVAFPLMFLDGFRYLRSSRSKEKLFKATSDWVKPVMLTTIVILLLIVIGQSTGTIKFAGFESKETSKLSSDNKIVPTENLIIPTFSPSSTTTSTTKPIQKPVYVNPDPIVDCGPGVTSKQYVKDKRSNCKNYVDCGLSGNTIWTMMLKTECDKKHAEESSKNNSNNNVTNTYIPPSNTTNKIPVFISYSGYTAYCPSQNIAAIQSINTTMESKKGQWQADYSKCVSDFQQTDSCYTSCKAINANDWDICIATYGYTGEENSKCEKTATDKYGQCISGCPSAYQACDWVYSERNRLNGQINDLCK